MATTQRKTLMPSGKRPRDSGQTIKAVSPPFFPLALVRAVIHITHLVANVLLPLSRPQMVALSKYYTTQTGKYLTKTLESETSGYFGYGSVPLTGVVP